MDVTDHPTDNFNTERSSPNMKTASNDAISTKYGATVGQTHVPLGSDLGTALKVMKEHRAAHPDSQAKMGAWDMQDK